MLSKGRFEKHQPPLHTPIDYAVLLSIMAIGLVPRFELLVLSHSVIDADEAIVGLMAKHIAEGRPIPIFYYGQMYMGSIEPMLAALSFLAIGMSSFALKLVPLIFSLLHIGAVYLLARRFTSRGGARVAALLTAVGPVGLIHWSTMARGGFIELVFLGTVALTIFADILKSAAPTARAFFTLGLLLGIGWWMNNQVVFFMAPIGLLALVEMPRCYGFSRSVKWLIAALAGFFLGGAPFWHANISLRPRWQTFETLTKKQMDTSFFDHLHGYFAEALPIIFGARRFWSDVDVFPGAWPILATLFITCLVLCAAYWRSLDGVVRSERPIASQFMLLVLFLVSVPIIFSASSFGWLSKAPRYLLPLYSCLYVVVGIAAGHLFRRPSFLSKAAGAGLAAAFFLAHVASSYRGGAVPPGQPFVFQGERVQADHRPLYRWLEENGYRHIRTNYWIGYRVAFETAERVTFSRFGTPRTLRIPEYELIGRDFGEDAPLVLVPREAELVERELLAKGAGFRRTLVGGYVVLDEIDRRWPPGEVLPIRPEQITVSSHADWIPKLIDGDAGTRWGSGAPQAPGMFVEISFPRPVTVRGLALDSGFLVHDTARSLEVSGITPGGERCELATTEGSKTAFDLATGEFGAVAPAQEIVFDPRVVRTLRLEQRGSHPVFDWSIAELTVYGEEVPGADPEQDADAPVSAAAAPAGGAETPASEPQPGASEGSSE